MTAAFSLLSFSTYAFVLSFTPARRVDLSFSSFARAAFSWENNKSGKKKKRQDKNKTKQHVPQKHAYRERLRQLSLRVGVAGWSEMFV